MVASNGLTVLKVAVAVIEREGKILISRRSRLAHQGDKWEFPGGKLESGESSSQALCRELYEELGIVPTRYEPLITVQHRYVDRPVEIFVFKVTAFSGIPEGREGQPVRWVGVESLDNFTFPAANLPIISALRLHGDS